MLELLNTAIYALALHPENSSRIKSFGIRTVGFTDLLIDDARVAEARSRNKVAVGSSCILVLSTGTVLRRYGKGMTLPVQDCCCQPP